MATTIQIDLDTLVYGEGVTLADAIVREAARQVLDQSNELRHLVRDRVQRITDDEIRRLFQPMLAEAVELAIQPTSPWGEPKGEPLTLREAIMSRMTKWLREPDPDFRGRGASDPRPNRVESFIRKEIHTAVAQDMRDTMNKARDEIVVGVKERASEVIAETIARLAVPDLKGR